MGQMGPRGLNKFLRCENPNGIKLLNLRELSGKKIVIDVSIYLYRFSVNDELFENFYNMLINFKKYNIIPMFVFDGKPPIEKQETIEQRRFERREAEKKYNEIMESNDITNYSKYNIESLKRKKVIISIKNKTDLKQLFDYYGVMYIDAPGEADELCAYYVKTNQAWACLSDDMDLFMYGCTRILRYLSLINMTVIYYDLNDILLSFNISFKNFINICILSGTDYNPQINKIFVVTFGIFISVLIYYINHFFGIIGRTETIPLLGSIWAPLLILFIISTVGLVKINEK